MRDAAPSAVEILELADWVEEHSRCPSRGRSARRLVDEAIDLLSAGAPRTARLCLVDAAEVLS